MLKKPIPQMPMIPDSASNNPTTALRRQRVSPLPPNTLQHPASNAPPASATPAFTFVNFGQLSLPKNATPMMATTNNAAMSAGGRQFALPKSSA